METSKILELNASFWNLLNREKVEESVNEIISHFHTLKSHTGLEISGNYYKKNKNDFKGMTDIGEVTLKQEETNKSFNHGISKERVGHFKIWKTGKDKLWFHHFWASEYDTAASESGEPEVEKFRILFDPTTLKLLHFGVERKKPLFSLGWFHISKLFIFPIFGKDEKFSSYQLEIRNH